MPLLLPSQHGGVYPSVLSTAENCHPALNAVTETTTAQNDCITALRLFRPQGDLLEETYWEQAHPHGKRSLTA